MVNRRMAKWGDVRVDKNESADNHWFFIEKEWFKDDDIAVEVQQVGTPREPMDFVHRALACGHPRTMAIHLPENQKWYKVIWRKASMGIFLI